jgi:hypothetical protein
MSLHQIKTEALIVELIDRCSDQLLDPEPTYDGILSFVAREELETVMDELGDLLRDRRISLRSEEGETVNNG